MIPQKSRWSLRAPTVHHRQLRCRIQNPRLAGRQGDKTGDKRKTISRPFQTHFCVSFKKNLHQQKKCLGKNPWCNIHIFHLPRRSAPPPRRAPDVWKAMHPRKLLENQKIWAASGLGKVHENPTIPMERSQVDSPPIVQFLGSTFRNLDSGGWWVFTNFCTPPCCSHQLYTIVTSSIPLNHPGSSVVRSRGISPNRIRWEVLQMTVSFGRIFWQISSSKSFVFLANVKQIDSQSKKPRFLVRWWKSQLINRLRIFQVGKVEKTLILRLLKIHEVEGRFWRNRTLQFQKKT